MNRKNLFYKFLFILFIFLILFNYCFRSNIVLAKTYSFESIPDEVLSVRDSSPYYKNPNYDWIIYFYDNSYYSILFIEKTDTLKFYVSDKYNGYWILANETFNGYFYTLNTSYSITSQEKLVNCDLFLVILVVYAFLLVVIFIVIIILMIYFLRVSSLNLLNLISLTLMMI